MREWASRVEWGLPAVVAPRMRQSQAAAMQLRGSQAGVSTCLNSSYGSVGGPFLVSFHYPEVRRRTVDRNRPAYLDAVVIVPVCRAALESYLRTFHVVASELYSDSPVLVQDPDLVVNVSSIV